MDPISIAFLVIGAVIVAVEACRYIKHKFFHHKEEHHNGAITIKAANLDMDDVGDLFKFANHNKDGNNLDSQSVGDHKIHATDIKITFASHDSRAERIAYVQSEHGGSKVAEELAHAVSGLASPWTGVANIVGNVLEEGAKHLPTLSKHTAEKSSALTRSVSDSAFDVVEHIARPSIHEDGCVSVGASPVLPRKFVDIPTINVVSMDDFGNNDSDATANSGDDSVIMPSGGDSDLNETWL